MSGLTRRGWTFVAAGGGALLAAVLAGSRDMLRVGLLLLLIPLISLLIAVRGRVRLGAKRVIEPPRVSMGEHATVHLKLSNRARVSTGVLLVEDTIPFALGARPRFVLDRPSSHRRNELTYSVNPSARGRYPVGPVTVRITDPFGMVELKRAFSDTSTLVVTPALQPLPDVRLPGERGGGGGRSRPRAITTTSEEDATVRAYRNGDDMRRVHWRATAHHGELMVRREEQAWQNRATLLLDTRTYGHAGEGVDSSFEWAVVAAASVGTHLFDRGYVVHLAVDEEAGHGRTAFLDTLAVVAPRRETTVAAWPTLLASADLGGGLVIAMLGRLEEQEARIVAELRYGASAGIAVLVDVASWTSMADSRAEHARLVENTRILRDAGWRVVTAGRSDRVAVPWERAGIDPVAGAA